MIGKFVLVYQQFPGDASPTPPFEVKIEGETPYMWKIVFEDLDGSTIRRMVNKGCCSTKPVEGIAKIKLRPKKSKPIKPRRIRLRI